MYSVSVDRDQSRLEQVESLSFLIVYTFQGFGGNLSPIWGDRCRGTKR